MSARPAVALALLLFTFPASARTHASLSLNYDPGVSRAGCPAERYLRGELARRFGYDPFSEPAPTRHLTVKIARRGAEYLVSGEIHDDPDSRVSFKQSFHHASCEQAVAVMGLAIAAELTTSPDLPPPPSSPPAPPSVIVLASAPSLPPAPETPAPPEARSPFVPRLQLGLGPALAVALAPSVVGGLDGFVGARWAHVSLAAEGRALFAPSTEVQGVPLTASVATGSLTGCAHYWIGFGCARGELGALFFQDKEGIQVGPAHALLAGFGARAGVEWPFADGRFALRGYGDLLFLGTRIRLVQPKDGGTLWRSSLVSPSFGLGIAASFF